IRTTASTSVTVNVFSSDALAGFGTAEARKAVYAERINSDAKGVSTFEFRFQGDLVGQWISATATTTAGTTELSTPIRAAANNQNYTVLNTEDLGAGPLRQAILDANAGICAVDFPCRVVFDLPSGHGAVAPLTPLPAIQRPGIIIDGANAQTEITGSRSAPGAGL